MRVQVGEHEVGKHEVGKMKGVWGIFRTKCFQNRIIQCYFIPNTTRFSITKKPTVFLKWRVLLLFLGWAERDLNPRPPECKSDALAN